MAVPIPCPPLWLLGGEDSGRPRANANGRPTVANGRPTQTPCGAHSAHTLVMVSVTWVSRRARSSACETKRAQLIDVLRSHEAYQAKDQRHLKTQAMSAKLLLGLALTIRHERVRRDAVCPSVRLSPTAD